MRVFSTLLISPSYAANNSLRRLKLINVTCKVSVRTRKETQFDSTRTISRSMMWSEMMEKINSLETSRIGSVKSGDIYIYIYITTGLGRRK